MNGVVFLLRRPVVVKKEIGESRRRVAHDTIANFNSRCHAVSLQFVATSRLRAVREKNLHPSQLRLSQIGRFGRGHWS